MEYSPGATSWSQVGYRKDAGGATMHWSQIATESGEGELIDHYGAVGLPDGATHNYTVEYDSRCESGGSPAYACLENLVDTTVFSQTPFDVDSLWGTSPWNWEASEESLYYGSNIPGTSASPTAFGASLPMEYLDSSLNWQTADCDFLVYKNNDTSHWGHHNVTSNCAHQQVFTYNPY